jgi:hypothetical protein
MRSQSPLAQLLQRPHTKNLTTTMMIFHTAVAPVFTSFSFFAPHVVKDMMDTDEDMWGDFMDIEENNVVLSMDQDEDMWDVVENKAHGVGDVAMLDEDEDMIMVDMTDEDDEMWSDL